MAHAVRGPRRLHMQLAGKHDTPREIQPLVACPGLTDCMPHPQWKGPREPVQLKLPKREKDLLAERARLTGLTYSEYVIALLHQEPLDSEGRPTWVALQEREDQALPIAM